MTPRTAPLGGNVDTYNSLVLCLSVPVGELEVRGHFNIAYHLLELIGVKSARSITTKWMGGGGGQGSFVVTLL